MHPVHRLRLDRGADGLRRGGDWMWAAQGEGLDLPIWEGDKISSFRLLEQERPFFLPEIELRQGDVLRRAVLDGEELAL